MLQCSFVDCSVSCKACPWTWGTGRSTLKEGGAPIASFPVLSLHHRSDSEVVNIPRKTQQLMLFINTDKIQLHSQFKIFFLQCEWLQSTSGSLFPIPSPVLVTFILVGSYETELLPSRTVLLPVTVTAAAGPLLVLLPEVSDTLELKFMAALMGHLKFISLLWSQNLMQGWLHCTARAEWFQRSKLLTH